MAAKETTPGLMLTATEEEYAEAGSKFITFTDAKGIPVPNSQWKDFVGKTNYRKVECGMPDWDTPGKSVQYPITIIEDGPDKGKEDKLSAGVDAKGVWKAKEINIAVLGKDLEMVKGADGKKHPNIPTGEYVGKQVIGVYEMLAGKKGGATDGAPVFYPKLTGFLPVNTKVEQTALI